MYQSKAFTLAEVLIALVVIGIIAAITLTTVMPNIQERVNSQRQANIVYKVTQATNLMKANGAMVDGFESTDKFVDELQKYLKIMKRCDSEHIADCWPTKKIRTSDGKDFDVSNTKTRKNLGFEDNHKDDKNVGIVLADGACLIMTYNPNSPGMSIGDPITSITTYLPVGGKFQTFLEYTSNTTGGLAFVMDVNGGKGPNSETINNKKYDIRSFNTAQFSTGCAGTKINDKCYVIPDSITPINCSHNPSNDYSPASLVQSENAPYCGSSSYYSNDGWAGAQKACLIREMSVADYNTLRDLCKNHSSTIGITTGTFWTDDNMGTTSYAKLFSFGSCGSGSNLRNRTSDKVICVAN